MSVLEKSFRRLVGKFEGDHFLRCFSSILWCSLYICDGSFHKMVSIPLPESVISVSLQQLCVEEYFSYLSLNLFIWRSPSSSPWIELPIYSWPFPLELQMKIFNPTMQICFLSGIVGVTSLNPILIPHVQSLGDLSLERGPPMLFFSTTHSCSLTKSWRRCITSFLHCTKPCASRLHYPMSTNSPMHFNLEQECSYLKPPWMFLWATLEVLHASLAHPMACFVSFVLSDLTWPNSSLVSSPLLIHGF
jgi:hypothetical protein